MTSRLDPCSRRVAGVVACLLAVGFGGVGAASATPQTIPSARPTTTTTTTGVPTTTSTAPASTVPAPTTTSVPRTAEPPIPVPSAAVPSPVKSSPSDGGAVAPSASAPIDPRILAVASTTALVQVLDALAGEQRAAAERVTALESSVARVEGAGASTVAEQAVAQERDLQSRLDAAQEQLRQLDAGWVPAFLSSPQAAPQPMARLTQPAGSPNDVGGRRAELASTVNQLRQDLEATHLRAAANASRPAAQTTNDELESARRDLAGARQELADITGRLNVIAQSHALATPGAVPVTPSQTATSDIPSDYLALYQAAARTCPGLSWTVLAGIGSLESSHGRSTLPGVRTGANGAGAMGPMQFLVSSWAAYGVDADHDGSANVYAPADAVFAAARYLCAAGAADPAHLRDAIWSYNHADWYVNRVLDRAVRYGSSVLDAPPAPVTPAALVRSPNVTLTRDAANDILSGRIDSRVVNLLAAAAVDHRIVVSVVQTGHSQFVKGTDRVSNHFVGRAVDIAAVDGVPVTASNYAALDLSLSILSSASSLRPDEFGSPWLALSAFAGAFTDDDHGDHLHIGYR